MTNPLHRVDVEAARRTFDKQRLLALAEREGLKHRGGRMQCPGRCGDDPRGASVSDSPGGALWHCKRCGAGGSVIDLIAAARNISIEDVLRQLDDIIGNAPPPVLKVAKPPMNGAYLWERLALADPPSEAYLQSRGLGLAKGHVRFNTGSTGDDRLDWWASKGYRLAVPLRDPAGTVVDFQLRAVTANLNGRDAKRSLFGERPRGTAFGRPDLAKAGGRIFVAEGMADTLALLCTGAVVVGAPGCDQLHRLAQVIPAKADVVLCPQNDAAGQSENGFLALERLLRQNRCAIRRLSLSERYKDPAEWLQDVGLEQFKAATAAPQLVPEPEEAAPVAQLPTHQFALTDTGNAERLVAIHGQDLRHSRALGWVVWDGQRWAPDDTGEVSRRAKATVRGIYAEAAACVDSDHRRGLVEHARRSESASKRRAMIELAESEPSIPLRTQDLDSDPWTFNCRNGTLDLRTGQLRPHRREDLLSKLAPVAYDASALCPRWKRFLEEVQPDPEIPAFLKRYVGYCMTGVIREHAFVINYGTGRNGKGVFVNTLLSLFGDYGRQVPTELLMAKRGEVHPSEKATLLGRRLAAASETEEGRSLNVALVKILTGGDQIAARFMHKDWFEFQPTHKLMLSTNHRPRIKETKAAIWSRVKLIPWEQSFPDGDPRQNTQLELELRAELHGILRWALEGCLEWQASGLRPPAAVQAATEDYRAEEDPVGTFLDDCCVLGDGYKTPIKDLRAAFEQWCSDNGDQYPLGGRAFNERLEARGLKRGTAWVCGCASKAWQGIGLVSANRPASQESWQSDT